MIQVLSSLRRPGGKIKKSLDRTVFDLVSYVILTVLALVTLLPFILIISASLLMFICSMTGYVLSRKDYKYRNQFSFFLFFTTIFSGGLVPW